MLYREIMAVCSEIHTKHINTVCGQNVELLNVKLAVHIVTTGLWKMKVSYDEQTRNFEVWSCDQQRVAPSGTMYITSRSCHMSPFALWWCLRFTAVDALTVTMNSEIIKMPHRRLLKKNYFHVRIFSFTVSRFCDLFKPHPQPHTTVWSLALSSSASSQTESFFKDQQFRSVSKNSPHFMKPEGSLPHSQEHVICPCCKPYLSSEGHSIDLRNTLPKLGPFLLGHPV